MSSRPQRLQPHDTRKHSSIRRAYISNLTDLLHVCLLRGDLGRAKRAWSILIRCREVDWKSRWKWGLLLLNHTNAQQTALDVQSQTQGTQDGRGVEKWLRSLSLAVPESERPAILHALVLHWIKEERYRAALAELETYLPSYPYLTSGPLHTYAGLLCFYLAQPESLRAPSTEYDDADPSALREPVNASLLRQARAWFAKAQSIDESDGVAQEYLQMIDHPDGQDDSDDDELRHLTSDLETMSDVDSRAPDEDDEVHS